MINDPQSNVPLDVATDSDIEASTVAEEAVVPERPQDEKSLDDLASLYDQGSPPKPPSSSPAGYDEEDEDEGLTGKMTFLEHLDEFRRRIVYSAIAIAVTTGGSFVFREQIFEFLARPIRTVVQDLVYTKVTDPFTIYLKVAFVAGIFVASPVVLAQVWLFIAPGLYRREKMYALPFLLCSTGLFLLGGAFAYYIILPTALRFLIEEFGRAFTPMLTALDYFSFEMIIIVGMGLIFQMPVLIAFLSIFGFVTPRFLLKNFRYAFLLIVILAAVISPTADALNLFLWSGPMVLLYIISIGVSWLFKRRRDKRLSAEV